MSRTRVPLFDDQGINLADPHDRLGVKSRYITMLQLRALRRLLGEDPGLVLDLGCGFGRTAIELAQAGWRVVGAEPSQRVLQHARSTDQTIPWVCAALPNLPFSNGAFDAVLLLNVVRSLHLLGLVGLISGAPRILARGGRLVVLDNVRPNHPNYVSETALVAGIEKEGLRLVERLAIRHSHFFPIYAIRYGLVPVSWLSRIADIELARMRTRAKPRFGYYNVIFVFEKL